MDEDFAYKITETIFKNLPDLELVIVKLKILILQIKFRKFSNSFHPGALNYFNN